MKVKISLFKSLKTKNSFMVLISSVLPLIIIGFISYQIARFSMQSTGLEQIRDTLEGSYALIQDYQQKVDKGELKQKEAFLRIRFALCGPIKEIWAENIYTILNLKEFLNLFSIEFSDSYILNLSGIFFEGKQIAVYQSNKNRMVFKDFSFIHKMIAAYDQLELDKQRAIVNWRYNVRLIHDFSKAVIKIRDSGYVWAITGNPGNKNAEEIFEIVHPSIGALNVSYSVNYVGRNIANMNGNIDTLKEGEIVRYDYMWQNPTDPEPRKKIVLMKYFKPWNWVVSSGLYEDEFFGTLLREIKIYIILGTVIFGVFFFFVAFIFNSRTLIRPLKEVILSIREMARGNLNISANVKTKDEVGQLAKDFNQLAISLKESFEKIEEQNQEIKNYNEHLEDMVEERAEKLKHTYFELKLKNDKLMEDLDMAQRLQLCMIPGKKDYPEQKEIQLASSYQAMESLGGDLYDIIKIGTNIYGFLIADVSGHGVSSALISSMAKASFHSHAKKDRKSGEVCKLVNQDIYKFIGDLEYYLTAYYAILNLETGEFQYTNAGHTPALLYRHKTRVIEKLDMAGFVIGSLNNITYDTRSIFLEPGDKVLFLTDGITETRNKNDELYHYKRVFEFMKNNIFLEPSDFIAKLFRELDEFCDGLPPSDDRAALFLNFMGVVEKK